MRTNGWMYGVVGLVVGLTMAATVVGAAESQDSRKEKTANPTLDVSPMVELTRAFERSAPLKAKDLEGVWILVRRVQTAKPMAGQPARDHVETNMNGIEGRPDAGRPQLEWTLTIERIAGGELETFSESPWGSMSGISTVRFDRNGDAFFEADYGDFRDSFRCRSRSANRLICLLADGDQGYGIEFLKTYGPPGPRFKPSEY